MSDMVTSPSPTPGLLARAVGIVVSPVDTFRHVVASPRSVGILFLVCVVMALAVGLPQMSASGKRAALDMQVQAIERSTGTPVTPDQYARMEQFSSLGAYFAMGSMFIAIPVFVVIFTALYWAFFNIVLGGNATFGQVLAVTSHSQVIGALGALLGAPIQYLQGTFSQYGPFNFGALVPMLEPTSPVSIFLTAITVFGIWQAVVGGLGLGVLYKRPSTMIVIALLVIYLGITALFTVVPSLVMGR